MPDKEYEKIDFPDSMYGNREAKREFLRQMGVEKRNDRDLAAARERAASQSLHPKLRDSRENQIRQLLASNPNQFQLNAAAKNFGDQFTTVQNRRQNELDDADLERQAKENEMEKAIGQMYKQRQYQNEFARRYGRGR